MEAFFSFLQDIGSRLGAVSIAGSVYSWQGAQDSASVSMVALRHPSY